MKYRLFNLLLSKLLLDTVFLWFFQLFYETNNDKQDILYLLCNQKQYIVICYSAKSPIKTKQWGLIDLNVRSNDLDAIQAFFL